MNLRDCEGPVSFGLKPRREIIVKPSTLVGASYLGLLLIGLAGVGGCESKSSKPVSKDGDTGYFPWAADVPVTGGTSATWMFKGEGMAWLVWLDWVPEHLPDGRAKDGLDHLGFRYEKDEKANDWAKGKITIGKQTYDLADGPVFLISKKDQQVEVKQLKREIAHWRGGASLANKASEDPEIAAFVGNKRKQPP